MYWHRDGAFVIFPISPGRYRVIADLPAVGAEYPPTPTLEQVQTIIDRRGPSGLKAFDPIWLAGFRINGRKVSAYRWGRAFLAGDAAHVGDAVLKSAAMLTTVGTMKNPVAQTLRNLVGHIMLGLSPVQHAFADTMTEVTIGYPKSPLNGPCLAGAGPASTKAVLGPRGPV